MTIENEKIPGISPDGIQPGRDVQPEIGRVVGLQNKFRVVLGKAPKYDDATINRLAGRGTSSITLMDRLGGNRQEVTMYSWQDVYEALRKAGLSPAQAQEETSKRVWILD